MSHCISKKAQNIEMSPTLSINAQFKKMLEDGKDVINFGLGEPDFKTPQNIKDEAILALKNDFTRYTDASGVLPLKEAICQKFFKDNNLKYTPSNIIVSSGAKQSLMNVFLVICNNLDEVIIPKPYWVSYPEMVKISGASTVFLETYEKDNFKIDVSKLEECINSKTKALILNSPSNPSGCVYTKKELEKIAKIAVSRKIYVISDEVYEKFTYDCKHISIASLGDEIKDLTIVINGVSKTYAMTGWRIGYAACSQVLAKAMSNIQSHMTSNPNSIAQYASIEALNGNQDITSFMHIEYEKRMTYLTKKIDKLREITCVKPNGAFYIFVNIKKLLGFEHYGKLINNSVEFCQSVLKKAEVALVPGVGFGMEGYVRLSFASHMDSLIEGMGRIEKYINSIT